MSITFVADSQALLAEAILVSPAGPLPNFALLLFETKPESQTVSEEETGSLRDIRGNRATADFHISNWYGIWLQSWFGTWNSVLDHSPEERKPILLAFQEVFKMQAHSQGSGLALLYTLNKQANCKIIAFLQKITASVPQKGLISYISNNLDTATTQQLQNLWQINERQLHIVSLSNLDKRETWFSFSFYSSGVLKETCLLTRYNLERQQKVTPFGSLVFQHGHIIFQLPEWI